MHTSYYKLFNSAMTRFMKDVVFLSLDKEDFIKFVVGSKDDFLEAVSVKNKLQERGSLAQFVFSPEFGKLNPDVLVQWMKEDRMYDSILNIQLHKLIDFQEQK